MASLPYRSLLPIWSDLLPNSRSLVPTGRCKRECPHHPDRRFAPELSVNADRRAPSCPRRSYPFQPLTPPVNVRAGLWRRLRQRHLQVSAGRIARFREQFPGAVIGGTGIGDPITVESAIGTPATALDYGLYPDFDASIGFTQRGCRPASKFCVVPKKKGKRRPVTSVANIWCAPRGQSTCTSATTTSSAPRLGRDRIAEIREGGFKVSFT
jgi:hypothetical protein